MTDAVLSQADQQEALSRAYVQAVAASTGYTTAQPDFDRDSIDLTVSAGGHMRPRIDLQLKATINLNSSNGSFTFALPIKNYNDLRLAAQTPRLIVVLDMPREQGLWLTCSREELVLRRSAYWASLCGCGETENRATVTINIPQANRFDVEGLRSLMDASRNGAIQ